MNDQRVELRHGDDFRGNTTAIQNAIDSVARAGGGRVIVPPGEWFVTTIQMRAGTTLHLARNCTIKAHHNLDDYPVFDECKENHDRQPYHLIYANRIEHFTIEGDGTIDGQGPVFWDPPLPGSEWIRHRVKRPSPLLEIRNCRHVTLRDFTIHESPGWTIHTLASRFIRISGLTIRNHMRGPNNDGIDITGCQDVTISDCDITGCDDNIIIKSMPDGADCERIAVTNCILETACACLGLGAESYGVIRDITFSNCVIRNSLRPIMIEMWDAGLVENITFNNITGRCFTHINPVRPIYLDVQHHRRTDGKLGTLRNVVISGVTMSTQGRCVMTCADGGVMENITIRDVLLRLEKIEDPTISHPKSKSVQLSNDSPETRMARAVVVADNIRRLTLQNIVADYAETPGFPMHAVVARKLRDAIIDCPHLHPSAPEVQALVNMDSDIKIRALAGI